MAKQTKTTHPSQQAWYVYLLRCADQSLYCGITLNLDKRLQQHNGERAGGAKYTRARRPCRIVYSELAENKSKACQREASIKTWTRQQKEQLIIQAGVVASNYNLMQSKT